MKPFPCLLCDNAFTTNRSLKHHIREHTGERAALHCSKCEKCFDRQRDLDRHEGLHKNINDRMQFVCEECGKTFIKENSLTDHEQSHQGVISSYCSKCGKGFLTEFRMKKHFARCQIIFDCTICGQFFREKYLLNKHLRNHAEADNNDSDASEKYVPRSTNRTRVMNQMSSTS